MTREEFLARAAALHTEWNKRYADSIEPDRSVVPEGEGQDDFAQHHADVSAPSAYADLLDEKMDALIREYHASLGG